MGYDKRLSIGEDVSIAERAAEGDVDGLFQLSESLGDESPHLRLNLTVCSGCETTSTLDIDLVTLEEDGKGNLKENSEDFSPVFVLTPAQLGAFKRSAFGHAGGDAEA